jgi:hypothetical protein
LIPQIRNFISPFFAGKKSNFEERESEVALRYFSEGLLRAVVPIGGLLNFPLY